MSQDPKEQPQKQFHVELEERLDHLSRQIDEWVDDAQSRGDTLKRLVTETRQQTFIIDGAPPASESICTPNALCVLVRRATRPSMRSKNIANTMSRDAR